MGASLFLLLFLISLKEFDHFEQIYLEKMRPRELCIKESGRGSVIGSAFTRMDGSRGNYQEGRKSDAVMPWVLVN